MLIIVLHKSSVLVTVHQEKKKAKINSDRKIILAFSRNSGVFRSIPVIFTGIGGRNEKRRSVIIFAPMVIRAL